jgi:hypothetical protein
VGADDALDPELCTQYLDRLAADRDALVGSGMFAARSMSLTAPIPRQGCWLASAATRTGAKQAPLGR